MKSYEQIEKLIKGNNGVIQTSEVVTAGISKPTFYEYVKEMKMEQIAQGIYIAEDAWVDSMYLLHLQYGQVIFSHETALYLHDLADREPVKKSVTVKSGYNTSRLKRSEIQVFTIKKDLHELGKTDLQTSFGNMVPVYDMERTICDIVRSRSKIEIQTFQDALKQYVRRKDKNLPKLMKNASIFHVDHVLMKYLEVLL